MKKILILYAPLGAGHKSAAKAIEEAFKLNYPDFKLKTIDVLDFSFGIFKKGVPATFNFVTSKIPTLYKWVYYSFNSLGRYHYLNRFSDFFIKRSVFLNFLKDFNPDFILSTNPLPTQLLSLTRQKNIINIPSANVCTDFGFHLLWYNPDVNYYFVSNENVKLLLNKYGVPAEKIKATGIPISLNFKAVVDRKKIFDNLSFEDGIPVILIVGGKAKYNEILKIIFRIKSKRQSQFIVISGRDKALAKELDKSRKFLGDKSVKIFGFVDDIQNYMEISDVILTKAGGLTVSECLQKELPMVINDFIPGQEEDNVRYIVENKAGFRANNFKEAADIINGLIANRSALMKIKKNCRNLARPEAAKEIADFVAEKLK